MPHNQNTRHSALKDPFGTLGVLKGSFGALGL
jgi:hypothetical protein